MKLIFKLAFTITLFVFYIFYPQKTLAQNILFEDDFNQDLSKWESVRGPIENWTIQDGRVGARVTNGLIEIVPNDQNWNMVWDKYEFTVDMFPIEGVDKNLSFRFQSLDKWNEIHHSIDGYGWYKVYLERVYPQQYRMLTSVKLSETENKAIENGKQYKIRIIVDGETTKVYITENDQPEKLIINYTDYGSPLMHGKIGLKIGTGASSTSEVWFDNVVVRELPQPTNTPSPSPSPSPSLSPSPSPSPSPTPIPTPTSPSFNVVNLKQYSIPWGEKIYGFTNKTISEFGCALTSASMILQYYGHPINPDQLNLWLKNQPDGYIRNGLVNWLAITRYTRLNDSLISPTLEYNRYGEDHDKLSQELFNQRPAILKLPGHFVVAKSVVDDTYGINDPGYANRATLDSYNNTYLSLNTFRPTHTDLSYMMFVVDKNINLILKDKNGNLIETQSFTETPIQSIYNSNLYTGETVKIYLVEKPQTQNYTVEISGPKGKYELNAYIYDETGNYTKKTFNGRLSGQDVDSYTIKYQKKNKIERDMLRDKLKLDNWFKYFFKSFKYGN